MEQLKIYQKWEDMAIYAYTALKMYPKSERHTLAADTNKALLEVGANITRANTVRNVETKRRYIHAADMELTRARLFIRLAMKLGFLSIKKYEILSGQLTEIGKMIGGWIKAS